MKTPPEPETPRRPCFTSAPEQLLRTWLARSRFNNLRIGLQLRIGFGVLVGLTFLAVGRSYLSSLQSTRYIQQTQEIRLPTVLASESAQNNLLSMQSDVRGYLATGKSEFRRSYQESRQAFEADLARMLTLSATQSDLVNTEILTEIQQAYEQWSLLPEQLFTLHDNILANQPAFAQLDQAEIAILKILDLVTQMQTEQSQRSRTPANHTLLKDLTDFRASFALMVGAVQSYLGTVEPSFRFDYTQYNTNTEAAWARILTQQNQLTPSQQERLAMLQPLYIDFNSLPPQLFEIVEGDRAREDLYLFRTEAEPLATAMIDQLAALVFEQQAGLERELEISRTSLITTQWQSVLLGLMTLCAALGLAYILQQQIAQRLTMLIQRTDQITQGDFDTTVLVQGNDEISILASTFNKMTAYLRQFRQDLQTANTELEDRVTDRTQELNHKNTELERLITELKTAQSQLVQNEKMSSLGQLVAGIAHEINNPVNFISGNISHVKGYAYDLLAVLQLYQKTFPEPGPAVEATLEDLDTDFLVEDLPNVLNSMTVGADRIREIVASLRNFSRMDEVALKDADLHEGIDSTLMILQHRLKEQRDRPAIVVNREYGELPSIQCFPGQLNQVFMNILANSIDALEESLSSQDESTHQQPTITIQTAVENDEWVTIAIADNGPGIPETVHQRIFDPFFTTKAVGKGTGMGLSISYQVVVDKHRGTLSCHSDPGQGTRFIITLPQRQENYGEC